MTIAFVHGNPETDAIWDELVDELAGKGAADLVLLEPPGFGAPIPDGWGATREEYRDWLVEQLVQLNAREPVDIVADSHENPARGYAGLRRVKSTRPSRA